MKVASPFAFAACACVSKFVFHSLFALVRKWEEPWKYTKNQYQKQEKEIVWEDKALPLPYTERERESFKVPEFCATGEGSKMGNKEAKTRSKVKIIIIKPLYI